MEMTTCKRTGLFRPGKTQMERDQTLARGLVFENRNTRQFGLRVLVGLSSFRPLSVKRGRGLGGRGGAAEAGNADEPKID